MIQEYIQFLSELKNNNNREWFATHKTQYQAIHAKYILWVEELLSKMIDMDSSLQLLHAKDCLFRINRDTRFSNDKSPYKTKISSMFSPSGKSELSCGYYFEIDSTGQLMIGGGRHFLAPQELFRVRKLLLEDPIELRQVLANNLFKNTFGGLSGVQLKTHPKGFSPESPNLDLLKYKNYIATTTLSIAGKSDEEIADFILSIFTVVKPLITLLHSL